MNKYEVYDFTEVSSNILFYEFYSFGPKGIIKMIVEFETTANENVYNLSFGNVTEQGTINDLIVNNNNDRDKILATVGTIVIKFIACHPECYIFFAGSTTARTRLYRIALSLNYIELSKSFNIWGLTDAREIEFFNPNQNYSGFLIKSK